VECGAAQHAQELQSLLQLQPLLQGADDDAKAYAELQSTWKKDHGLTEQEIQTIQQRALQVPTDLVVTCHEYILAINKFLEHCNPNITSDAKVGIHQLAGAARAAYQTVLVNAPPLEEKKRLQGLLKEIWGIESKLLESDE
jgi:formiminotetrahydrofolate cyclodeaminase